MIEHRPFAQLGAANHGWLDARFHFSFSNYYNPARMGWGKLLVWNDDTIAPRSGFPPHPHRDMEIITYVRTGAITHEDSMGNRGRTEAGDVQVMSAGAGVRHAEYNLENEPTTLFQIWIEPDQPGGAPSWGARKFPKSDRANQWSVLASGRGDTDALPIRADATLSGATLDAGAELTHTFAPGRRGYIAVAAGRVRVNGLELGPRDGAAIADESAIVIEGVEGPAEIVLADTL